MTQKFYFHDATSSDTGTLPTTWQGATVNTGTSPVGFATARAMDSAHGSAQASATGSGSFFADIWMRSWVSGPLAAQTIGAGTWTIAAAIDDTAAGDTVGTSPVVFAWRPSTGALVGMIFDGSAVSLGSVTTAAETGSVGTFSGSAVTLLANDILVIQLGCTDNDGVGTGAPQCYYDGTTDPVQGTATSNAASYLLAPADISLFGATAAFLGFFSSVGHPGPVH